MVNIPHGARIVIPDDVLHQEVDGEVVMLHLGTEAYYGLDDIGSRVWNLLKEYGAVEPVVAAILAEYNVDEASLRVDIDDLVGELASAGLIEVGPGPGP